MAEKQGISSRSQVHPFIYPFHSETFADSSVAGSRREEAKTICRSIRRKTTVHHSVRKENKQCLW